MKHWTIARRALGLAVLVATAAGGSARAAAPAQTSACAQPSYSLSQPFVGLGDLNSYTLAPGQGAGGFDGEGWTLTGGARIVTTTLADGSTGTVLDLPASSIAVSPPMCVSSDFPTARVTVRQAADGPGMKVFVVYTGGKSGGQSSGTVNGSSTWGASRPFELHAGKLFGWQQAQYTFQGAKGGAQVYDFYVDPHVRW
jgi:hypothetical protein